MREPHRSLVQAATAVLEHRPEVAAAWLAGSLGRGDDDDVSDVDIHCAVHDGDYENVSASWLDLVNQIGPTIMRRALPGPRGLVILAVTPTWMRYDLALFRRSEVEAPYAAVQILFDRDGVSPLLTAPAESSAPVPAEHIVATIEEFLRCMGLLVVVTKRGEWLSAHRGTTATWDLLVTLMQAEMVPEDRSGAKRFNRKLTAEQRAVLEALPPATPTALGVTALNIALARAFLPRARSLCSARDIPYPEGFETATLQYLNDALGLVIDIPEA